MRNLRISNAPFSLVKKGDKTVLFCSPILHVKPGPLTLTSEDGEELDVEVETLEELNFGELNPQDLLDAGYTTIIDAVKEIKVRFLLPTVTETTEILLVRLATEPEEVAADRVLLATVLPGVSEEDIDVRFFNNDAGNVIVEVYRNAEETNG